VPAVGDALQLVLASVFEGEAGTRNQVPDRLRNENLGRGRECCDPRADAHGDPSDLAGDGLDLACVYPGAPLEPEVSNRVADRLCAPDPARGAVERGKEPIASRVDFRPAEPAKERSDGAVMTIDERAPAAVTQLSGLRRRPDDVGENHRREHAVEVGLLVADLRNEPLDLAEQLVLVPCPEEVVDAGERDEASTVDLIRQPVRRLGEEKRGRRPGRGRASGRGSPSAQGGHRSRRFIRSSAIAAPGLAA